LTAALDAVYCYEDFALSSFRQARRLGVRCIYDLPACYYEAAHSTLATEVEREPALRPFVYELRKPVEKLIRKEEEIGLATQIVCASSFTRQTIPAGIRDRTPVTVVPYGVDTARPRRAWAPEDLRGKLKLIFAGKIGPHKGIHILFEALHSLPPKSYELSLAGRWIPGFEAFLNSRFSVNYKFLGQLRDYELTEAYLQSHLLVFPSLSDGFGLVLLEAMACGIPVVTTERTGGPDLLQHGGGYLVRAGDADALRTCVEEIMCSRQELPAVSSIARHVAEQHSWQRYRAELIAALHTAAITAESPMR
jgi:glycosyltransferase involved in cell wall biosynthesis